VKDTARDVAKDVTQDLPQEVAQDLASGALAVRALHAKPPPPPSPFLRMLNSRVKPIPAQCSTTEVSSLGQQSAQDRATPAFTLGR